MGKSPTGEDCLITELPALHQTVNAHFQNIAGSPPSIQMTLDMMNDRWRRAYSPMSSVQSSIYSGLMSPIADEEWKSVLSSLPTSKAPGPSGISYEMIKHLPSSALAYLRDIIDFVFLPLYFHQHGKTLQYILYLSRTNGIVFCRIHVRLLFLILRVNYLPALCIDVFSLSWQNIRFFQEAISQDFQAVLVMLQSLN